MGKARLCALVRVQVCFAAVSVQRGQAAVACLQKVFARHHYSGDAHGAGKLGRMGVHRALGRDKPQNQAAVQQKNIGGVYFVCGNDGRARKLQNLPRAVIQRLHHAVTGVQHIAGALSHIIVVQRADAPRKDAGRALYRCGGPGTCFDIPLYLFAQALIIQHHALGGQNVLLRAVCLFFHFLQLGTRNLGGRTEALKFLCGAHHHPPKACLDMAQPAHRAHRKAGRGRNSSYKFHPPGPLFRCVMYMPAPCKDMPAPHFRALAQAPS